MPAQTFTCVICKEETTKPKSYAVPEMKGRACRHHQEAVKAHENNQAAEEKARQAQVEKAKNDLPKRRTASLPLLRDPRTFCWCCNKDGVQQAEAIQLVLEIDAERTAEGKPSEIVNPLLGLPSETYEAARKQLGGKPVIRTFMMQLSEKRASLLFHKDLQRPGESFVHIHLISGLFVLCTGCAKLFEIDWMHGIEHITPQRIMDSMLASKRVELLVQVEKPTN